MYVLTQELPIDIDVDTGLAPVEVATRWTAARCRDGNGTLTALFFSDDVHDIARAKAICAKCPLRIECLDGALERAEPWGVWGGELLDGGRIVVTKRPRGRPPKHGHAPVLIDEDGNALPAEPRVA
jgi:WhiB family redox-sensing transcriptional regulator